MADYFDRLETELRGSVPRASAHPQRIRLRSGSLVVAISVAVTAAVVVLAVALVGHAHEPAHPTAPASSPPAALATAGVPTLQQLLANFAVLRRSQTAADRSWRPDWSPTSATRPLPALTRLARTLANGDQVFVSLEQLRAPGLGQAAGSYSMALWVVDRLGDSGSANFGPATGYTISPMEFPAPGQELGQPPIWTSLVPGGVANVRWTFACGRGSTPCLGRGRVTVQVTVRNNIASASVPQTGGCIGATVPCRPPAAVAWYAPGGRVIETFAGRALMPAAAPFVQDRPLGPVTTAQPLYTEHRIRNVLIGDGIAAVRFGQSRIAAINVATPLLGPASTGYIRVHAECGVDHTMTWPNWAIVSAHGTHYAFDPVLTVYFDRSRFVGYQYGEFGTTVAPRTPSHGTVLATTRGLNIGDTLARGEQLYGSAFGMSTAQGGIWKAGRLKGYAWGDPGYGAVSAHSVVATIDAGDVGCPALSP